MTPAYEPRSYPPAEGVVQSVRQLLLHVRDWLDARGRVAWLAAMILGLVFAWPVGLAILGYMIWSKRMFGTCTRRSRHVPAYRTERTGNAAFDAYRDETLKRLEDEHRAFLDFLQKLREARDKAEFDQFMDERRNA
ncbi:MULTISPECIES: DUF2852 domain-containing protein [unclassified Paracoccus (in: a-proteobacteria)]|uniref:DUF2852 domain-containing protein n=1 Tax=unclassified Paracoccus (in: a-proteobacteria) TaxID=2688777 RepID=UPI0015FF252F|nr:MULTISPECIES: DUF2852 domain-containing protein [unclassified Paracoccus (in: a-proteobacteria)]MBB1490092.1 DUF2852 domain-containing protein [Paracoccus sp. MC1854]MBB1496680.1 DUF2852 domain-containing protein [Paracoccus sp. MC1862]QQO43691.1 DUF2852 domain-containing protein [Paracoccus sp. MC1862]